MSGTVIRVESADGTRIALHGGGRGPSLIVVHGTAGDSGAFALVAPLLEDVCTVYRMDRRGRGESGDGVDYSFAREVDDVVATAQAVPGPVYLYGHSFGGGLAWEAARRLPELAGLILYEGGPKPPVSFFPDDVIADLQAVIDEGRDEQALTRFLLDAAGVSESDLTLLRRQPAWAARVAAARTIPRELRANNDYAADPASFDEVRIPVLLLLGSESLPRRREMFEDFTGRMHDARIVELDGQGHAANTTAPQLVADAIREYMESRRASIQA